MKKHLLTFLMLTCLLSGCGGEEAETPAVDNLVRVGVDPNYPPFESVDEDSGGLIGFDIDLMTEIAAVHGWDLEFTSAHFDELLPGVASGRFDIVISALTITAQREAVAAFSDPYYLVDEVLSVPAGDSTTVALEDLKGRRVGVQAGSTGEELAKRVDGVLAYPYDDVADAFSHLLDGQLDAILNDLPTTLVCIGEDERVRVIARGIRSEYYGIAVNPNDPDKLDRINQTLAVFFGDGSFDRLHEKWFGHPMLGVSEEDTVFSQ